MEEPEENNINTEQPEEIRPVKKRKRLGKPIHNLLEGDFLSRKGIFGSLPFLFFLGIIGVLYIANTFYAEKTYKEIEKTKSELKELRFQYITTKSVLMYQSKQVEIAIKADSLGLKESLIPPFKVYYPGESGPGKNMKE